MVGGEGGLQDAGGRVRVNSLQAQGWARESGEEVEGLEGCGRCDADIINAAVGVCSSVKGSRLKLLSGHALANYDTRLQGTTGTTH